MNIDIRYCARCEQDHKQLKFTEFSSHPIEDEESGIIWTHWALCPVLNEPILLHIKETGADKELTK